jgi:hypothetical protein
VSGVTAYRHYRWNFEPGKKDCCYEHASDARFGRFAAARPHYWPLVCAMSGRREIVAFSIPIPGKERNVGRTVGAWWAIWSRRICRRRWPKCFTRHLTISLTMDRYTHLGIADLVDGLKRLPMMAGGNGVGAGA